MPRIALLVTILALSGCRDPEGVFEPACIAYEGDRITLSDGRFEWHRFTDERRVDESGNPVDPFPGYPKRGSYERDDARVLFFTDDGEQLAERYLFEDRKRIYLLTWDENEAVLNGEGLPACALRLSEG